MRAGEVQAKVGKVVVVFLGGEHIGDCVGFEWVGVGRHGDGFQGVAQAVVRFRPSVQAVDEGRAVAATMRARLYLLCLLPKQTYCLQWDWPSPANVCIVKETSTLVSSLASWFLAVAGCGGACSLQLMCLGH